jgi:hypothetical protein
LALFVFSPGIPKTRFEAERFETEDGAFFLEGREGMGDIICGRHSLPNPLAATEGSMTHADKGVKSRSRKHNI